MSLKSCIIAGVNPSHRNSPELAVWRYSVEHITIDSIKKASYNQLIAIIQETNRPPGGSMTITEIASRSFLRPGKTVLDVGTSTGVTAVTIALMTGANVVAIDINERSLSVGKQHAKDANVEELITFDKQDVTQLPYDQNSFDLVFCGNVTSLVSSRDRAFAEYLRVLKPGGILAAVPMYYVDQPSSELVQEVSQAIQVNIVPQYKDYWMKFFSHPDLRMMWSKDYRFDKITEERVNEYVASLLKSSRLSSLDEGVLQVLTTTYTKYMQLFRFNLQHMGFTILLLQKAFSSFEEELFTGHEVTEISSSLPLPSGGAGMLMARRQTEEDIQRRVRDKDA